jgi:hypothetical protein
MRLVLPATNCTAASIRYTVALLAGVNGTPTHTSCAPQPASGPHTVQVPSDQ